MASVLDLSPLREGQLRRLVLAQLTSTAGDFMVLAALPFAVFSIGGSVGQVGIALAAQAVVLASLLIVGGIVGDRLPRRSVVVGADLLRFASQGVVAVLLISGGAEFWQLLCAQAVLGAGTAFFMPAMNGLVAQAVPLERLQQANALRGMTSSSAGVIGPALAAAVLAASGPGWAFAVDALSFLISAALLARLRLSAQDPPDRERSVISDLIEGWTEFRRRTWVWVVVAEFALLNTFVFAPFFVFGPTVAMESLGGPGAWAGILAAMGLGELAGGLVALSWRPARPLLAATLAMGLWTAPLLLLAILAPVGLVAVGAAAAGFSLAVFGALWETTLQAHIPANLRSRLSSYDLLGSLGLLPVGYLLGALVQDGVGAEPGLIAAAGIIAVATFIVVAVPSVRELKRVEDSARRGAGAGAEAAGRQPAIALVAEPR
jgi:MFS family permease